MYSVQCCWTTNSQSGSSRSGISELNDQPPPAPWQSMTTISFAPAAFAPRTRGVDLLRVEAPALLVHRVAAARLLPLDDAGDALHVADDVNLHGCSLSNRGHRPRRQARPRDRRIGRDRRGVRRAFAAEGAGLRPLPRRPRARRGGRRRDRRRAGRRRPHGGGGRPTRSFARAGRLDVCAAVAGVWPAEDVPVWELPLERWEQTLRPNLGRRSSPPAASCARWRAPATAASSWWLDGRPLRRGGPRRLRGREVGARRPAAQPEERGRPRRAARARQRGRAGVDAVADDPRGRSTTRRSTAITRTMALRKVATPEDVARQIVVLSSDELSGHVDRTGRQSPAAWKAASVHDS